MMNAENRKILYDYAMSLCGVPYRWGGSSPMAGMDCSGLVIVILHAADIIRDIRFDTTAQGLYKMFEKAKVAPSFGALSFYGKSLEQISHVGFCLSEKVMVHAASGDSSVIDRRSAEAKSAFVRVSPVTYRRDYLISVMPPYKP